MILLSAQFRSYWWPRRKALQYGYDLGRRWYNGQSAQDTDIASQTERDLLASFHLSEHGHPGSRSNTYGKTATQLSFDIHLKRRKYVENLVAKSIAYERQERTETKPGEPLYMPSSPKSATESREAAHALEWPGSQRDTNLNLSAQRSQRSARKQADDGGVCLQKVEEVNLLSTNLSREANGDTKSPLESSAEKATNEQLQNGPVSIHRYSPSSTRHHFPSGDLRDTMLIDQTRSIVGLDSKNRLSLHDSMQIDQEDLVMGAVCSQIPKFFDDSTSKEFSMNMSSPQTSKKQLIKDTLIHQSVSDPQNGRPHNDTKRKHTLSDRQCREQEIVDDSSPSEMDERDTNATPLSGHLQQNVSETSSLAFDPDIDRKPSSTIHIIGMGPVGKYLAHSLLRTDHGPPITLLMYRQSTLQQWHQEGAAIKLLKGGKVLVASGFSIESSIEVAKVRDSRETSDYVGERQEHSVEQSSSVIDQLIVTTSPNDTVKALSSIKHRLRESSTICLIQNGLGMVEMLNAALFTDPYRRPTYMLASISHKLSSTEHQFTLAENNPGQIVCSKLPRRNHDHPDDGQPSISRLDFSWSQQSKHLVRALYQVSDLNTNAVGHKSFFRAQLEKLAVAAVIGPLSVVFDCTNDQLLYNHPASTMMKTLLKELSTIITSLPEMRNMSHAYNQFSPRRLEYKILSLITRTGSNQSDMLQAIRRGDHSDIDFLNGWLMQKAAQLRIANPVNEMLVNVVKGKQIIKKRESARYIPFQKS